MKVIYSNELGTTYLISVFWPDGISADEMSAETILMQLKHEIIKRWFVHIYNEQLKCYIRITDGDSEVSIEKKDLDTIPELHHKIEILDWYNNGADAGDKRFKREKIEVKLPVLTKSQMKKAAKIYGKKIGYCQNKANLDLVVRVLSEDEASFDGFLDEEGIGTVNRVALVRNKGMIVNHYPYQGRYKQDFISLASERKFEAILFTGKMCINEHTEEEENHLEMFLSYAENPAHNEWIDDAKDVTRCNLKRFEERPTPFPVSRVRLIFNRIYSIISEFFPKDDKPPVKKEICSFWRKLYKLPSAGDRGGGEAGFSYETLQEGFDSEGRYSWKLKVTSLNSEKKLKLTFVHYLNSLEGPIKKAEEFSNLGVPEFEELHIIENGVSVDKVVLEYDNVAEEGKPIMFRSIDLNDVVGKVVVQSELIRTKNSNPISPHIAFSNLTVLSRNRSVAFYVDEVEDVGGNALPITPGETLDKMFVMKNMNPLGVEPPTLVYHKKFKDFFNNGDDYETVKCIMLLIGLPYCEQLLKWIVFGKPDYGKEEHQVIINLIGELCFYREKDMEEITNEADDDKKVQSYLKLSNLLFENVQGMGMGWKKMLRQIVENEKK